jgi:hypothetical protein
MVTRNVNAAALKCVATAVLVTLVASCDSGPPVPMGPGQLDGLLFSPNGAEGAAVLQLTGADIGAIELEGGSVFRETDGFTTRIVVILDEPGDIQFRVYVAERSEPPEAAVVEVADGDNQLRTQLGGYRIELTPVADTLAASTVAVK